ncbi:MAG: beta-ketoacyl synthase N-terminal-like domain-containing protein [Burkholderiaceae bacterium]
MKAVHLQGRALASGLGPDLAAALAALRRGGVAPGRLALGGGHDCLYHALDDDLASPWAERARRWVQAVAAASGALDGPRTGALVLASSSMDIGRRERDGDFSGRFDDFAAEVAHWLGWRGTVHGVSNACTSGLNALLAARSLLESGEADEALVLGIELRSRVTPAGFLGMQLLSPGGARPLAAGRDGMVLGEAVAALRLAPAPARWRLAGGANRVDGRDSAGAAGEAIVATCRAALADAGVAPGAIGLVKLQAAGSPANDEAEARALQQLFGAAGLPPLVTLKAALGHTLGAAGVAELALLTACLDEAAAPAAWPGVPAPADPALGLALAPACPPAAARHVLANIFGFGGGHAAVVLEDLQA